MTIELEHIRQNVQERLDKTRDTEYRRKLGQFATPFAMAQDIVSYSLSLLGSKEIRFLEPALGTGSFYSALLESAGKNNIDCATGFEIDTEIAAEAKQLWGDHLGVLSSDFTRAQPQDRLFNLLVSNPPYVRHHYLSSDEKSRLHDAVQSSLGIDMSKLAGLYCYFMLLSHRWLEDGAVSAWLVPSEFMDVNYGVSIKEYLLDKVRLIRIHRYDPQSPMFDDALVSSAVVWFVNERTGEDYSVDFTFGGTIEAPAVSRTVHRLELNEERKWTIFPQSEAGTKDQSRTKVKDLFTVKRGIATGDNSFFILNRDKVTSLGLKRDYLVPVLPSPRFLDTIEVFADENGDPVIDNLQYLINCELPEEIIKEIYPELFDYLQSGSNSVANRYLCRSRRYWYQQEQREPAPILCTYMGRERSGSQKPFRFILNHSKAIATNSYLMLYPNDDSMMSAGDNSALLRETWDYLNSLPPEALTSEGRVYGGGLHKLEPRELGEVICTCGYESLQQQMQPGFG